MTKQKQMTKQAAFNRVWHWFVTAGHGPSLSSDGDPRYRGPNGRRCAIGLLLPQRLYDPEMEGNSFSTVCEEFAPAMTEAGLMGFHDGSFGRDLRDAHDDNSIGWPESLRDHGLTCPGGR